MAVGFSQIPSSLLVPLFYAEIDPSRAGGGQPTQRMLLIGQSTLSLASMPRVVANYAQAAALFGPHSMLARMVAKVRENDTFGEVWCLNVADGTSAAAATGTITVGGPSTAAGTLFLYVGGRLVTVAVASGATANTIATAIGAAINAASPMAVTASVSSAVVTLTARHPGLAGNDIDIRANYRGSAGGEATPAGVTLTIAAMSGGTVDPDLSVLDGLLADEAYDFIVTPYTATTQLDQLRALMNDQAGRWAWSRQVFGHVFGYKRDTAANLLTFGAGRNDQHVAVAGWNDSPTPPDEAAAALAAVVAASVRADPARPLQTLVVNGVLAPPRGSRFTFAEKQSLLASGVAQLVAGDDGTVSILRMVTTYRQNAFGQTDRSYLDVETLFTLADVIRRLRGVVTTKFGRSKLASNGTRFGPGQPIVTPNIIRAELIAQYAQLERLGLVENAEGFAANLVVERDENDPSRVNVLYPPDLINGLRVFATLAQFRA